MDEMPNSRRPAPDVVVWYGRIIIAIGALFVPLGIIGTLVSYFSGDTGFFVSLYILHDSVGTAIGICGFGIAVANGRRWHIFGLLILIFFGSLVIGLFSMVGRETHIGYYIWAVGGMVSLSLLLILGIYSEELIDG
jgi:hypothetical protein